MKKCENCGITYTDKDKFCANCGGQLYDIFDEIPISIADPFAGVELLKTENEKEAEEDVVPIPTTDFPVAQSPMSGDAAASISAPDLPIVQSVKDESINGFGSNDDELSVSKKTKHQKTEKKKGAKSPCTACRARMSIVCIIFIFAIAGSLILNWHLNNLLNNSKVDYLNLKKDYDELELEYENLQQETESYLESAAIWEEERSEYIDEIDGLKDNIDALERENSDLSAKKTDVERTT